MQKTPACHAGSEESAHSHHHRSNGSGRPAGRRRLAEQSTRHCQIGCVIGEVIGLAIGVEAGLSTTATIILATTLAYISGFTLGLLPVMKGRGLSLVDAFKLIWIGEAVSIGVSECHRRRID